jgi:hydroxyacylglutathione hydrolase
MAQNDRFSDRCSSVRRSCAVLLALVPLMVAPSGRSQLMPGSMDVHWNEGSPNCAKSPQMALQVHPYNSRMFILRENLCSTFEAPFLYLLVGSAKALLVDTGDISDPKTMPLADTVMKLLPGEGTAKLPLLVVHTHRHLDHRAGDAQFRDFSTVQVVGFDLDSVRRYYRFANWPDGMAEISLGDRTVDAIPTPGHNETEVSFYDRETGLFLSGDFLMPARLLVDNSSVYLASAERVAAFVKDRPVSFVLGGHIEQNAAGELYPWESRYHPGEHVLQMTKDDLLALPGALRSFNGIYTVRGKFTMENSVRILIAFALLIVGILAVLARLLVRYLRRRKLTHA